MEPNEALWFSPCRGTGGDKPTHSWKVRRNLLIISFEKKEEKDLPQLTAVY